MKTLTKITRRQKQIISIMMEQSKDLYWFSTKDNRVSMCKRLGITEITLKQHLQRMRDFSIIVRPEGVPKGAYLVNMVRYVKLT
jgi:hypothetical protein